MKKIIKDIYSKYKAGKLSVNEQVAVRLAICLLAVMFVVLLDTVMDFLVWIYPIMDYIVYVAVAILVIWNIINLYWYFYIWAYGDSGNDGKSNYPYILNAVFVVITDIYSAIGVMQPMKKSSVIANGQKTFNKGNWIVYRFNVLVDNVNNMPEEKDIIEILQNELIRKSKDGFEGICFDNKGFPYLQVENTVLDGAYLQIQIIVFWNEAEKKAYETELENKEKQENNTENVEDVVF